MYIFIEPRRIRADGHEEYWEFGHEEHLQCERDHEKQYKRDRQRKCRKKCELGEHRERLM